MLDKLRPAHQSQIVAAMTSIETLLTNGQTSKFDAKPSYILRDPRAGDFGWIISRHAQLYLQEYGWGEPFEGLCAQIVADFVNNFDAERERCWIAELNGENVGCVMLVKDGQPGVARIRLLLVDPKGRRLGLGAKLVDECVRFARAVGYAKIKVIIIFSGEVNAAEAASIGTYRLATPGVRLRHGQERRHHQAQRGNL